MKLSRSFASFIGITLSLLIPVSKGYGSIDSDLRAIAATLEHKKEVFSKAATSNRAAGAGCCILGTMTCGAPCCCAEDPIHESFCRNGGKYECGIDDCNVILRDLYRPISFLDSVEKAFSQFLSAGKIDWKKLPASFKEDLARYVNANYSTFERAVAAIHTCNQSGLNDLISDRRGDSVLPRVQQVPLLNFAVHASLNPQRISAPLNYTAFVTAAIIQEMSLNPSLANLVTDSQDYVPLSEESSDGRTVDTSVGADPSPLISGVPGIRASAPPATTCGKP